MFPIRPIRCQFGLVYHVFRHPLVACIPYLYPGYRNITLSTMVGRSLRNRHLFPTICKWVGKKILKCLNPKPNFAQICKPLTQPFSSGWWFQTLILLFHSVIGILSSSQLTNSIIFQRGRAQPPTSHPIFLHQELSWLGRSVDHRHLFPPRQGRGVTRR